MTACVSRAWAMDKYLEVQNLEWAAGFNEATASGANRVGLAEGVFLCCLLLLVFLVLLILVGVEVKVAFLCRLLHTPRLLLRALPRRVATWSSVSRRCWTRPP